LRLVVTANRIAAMTDPQKQRFVSWVLATIPAYHCSFCGNTGDPHMPADSPQGRGWEVGPILGMMPNGPFASSMMPVLTIACTKCHHLDFFDAERVGVLKS
jgi:hypothetical protein